MKRMPKAMMAGALYAMINHKYDSKPTAIVGTIVFFPFIYMFIRDVESLIHEAESFAPMD